MKMQVDTNIEKHLKSVFENLIETVELEYEMKGILNDVEHAGRDGFIPFTDGGYNLTVPLPLSYVVSTGKYPGNLEIEIKLDKVIEYNYELALETFREDNEAELKKLFNVGNIDELDGSLVNYHSLYEMKKSKLAESLSEIEMEYLSDGSTLFLQYRVFFFDAENTRNETGENELYFHAGVNLDFDYGRDKGLELTYERTVKASDLTPELIDKIIDDMAKTV